MRMRINPKEIENTELEEFARLAALYALPSKHREHDHAGDQMPRLFPREHEVVIDDNGNSSVVSDAASHGAHIPAKQKTKKLGLHPKYWQPMRGGYTHGKRIEEIDTAIALLNAEKDRLNADNRKGAK